MFNVFRTMVLASTVLFGASLTLLSKDANATPAFARSTGAACNKCHSEMFPRLNERGERFLRNGFQVRAEEGVSLDAPGESKEPGPEEGKKIGADLFLNNLSNLFSIYGVVDAFSKNTGSKNVNVGTPHTLALLATGTLAKDVPVFMELEVETQEGKVGSDRFFIGMTNLGGTTTANVRTGSLDPTEWTSFPSLAAEAFKAGTDHVGVYSGADAGKEGFAAVGSGLAPRHAMEYYGYTDGFVWAAALANPPTPEDPTKTPSTSRNLDYWLVGRYDVAKTGSVSVLYYNSHFVDSAPTWVGTRVLGLSANLRLPAADILAQYTRDSGTDNRGKVFGATLQANVPVSKKLMAIARYDMTDNGGHHDTKEAVLSLGAMYKPAQNLKVTAAFTNELSRADTGEVGQAGKSNGFNVNLHYAL